MRRALIIISGILVCSITHAQSLYNKSLISIRPNTILFVDDSLVNNGTIINNGDMQVGGAWINNNQYDAGTGQITFNSDHPQVINHNDQSFSKLTISGGGEKRFLANITIENELNLSDGVLVSSNDAKIIFNSTAHITGGSDDAYIVGAVYHKGPGQKFFPVGDGNNYLPVTLTNIEGATAEVGLHVVDLNNTSTPLKKEKLLTAISDQRYWELDVVSGSIANSKAILPVVDESIVTSETLAVVAESDALSNEFRNLGHETGTQLSNDRVTSNNFISMRFLAVGAKKDNESVFVYNAISPNGDDKNGVLIIDNIESFPDNKVSLFNRWGDKVFEMIGYDNEIKVFVGRKNIGSDEDLSAGTYYYVIHRREGLPLVNGYLTLRK